MAKDPAFLFYPSDWSSGTMLFTREEKGAYMDLLMCQFHHGHMTSHDVAQLLGQTDYERLWVKKLKAKFNIDNEGLFFNERLETEQLKRKNWCESRNNNKLGSNQYSGHMTGHTGGHMVNENVNENINENINILKKNNHKSLVSDDSNKSIVNNKERESFKLPSLQQVIDYCKQTSSPIDPEQFWHNYESSGWIKANGQKVKNWKSTIRTWEKRDERSGKNKQQLGSNIERARRKEQLDSLSIDS